MFKDGVQSLIKLKKNSNSFKNDGCHKIVAGFPGSPGMNKTVLITSNYFLV